MGKRRLDAQRRMLLREAGATYCCDANTLKDLYYAGLLKKLGLWVRTGHVKIPEGVYRELRQRSDRLRNVLRTWDSKYSAVVQLNLAEKNQLSHIERTYGPQFTIGKITYPGLWASRSGKRAADGQVIAVGKVRGWVVVSNDGSVKGACAKEGIECIAWEDFARRLGLIGLL